MEDSLRAVKLPKLNYVISHTHLHDHSKVTLKYESSILMKWILQIFFLNFRNMLLNFALNHYKNAITLEKQECFEIFPYKMNS